MDFGGFGNLWWDFSSAVKYKTITKYQKIIEKAGELFFISEKFVSIEFKVGDQIFIPVKQIQNIQSKDEFIASLRSKIGPI